MYHLYLFKFAHSTALNILSYRKLPGLFDRTAAQIMEPLSLFVLILHNICWMIGVTFIIGSLLRYLDYRQNKGQSPISQALFLGSLGLVFIILPFITRPALHL